MYVPLDRKFINENKDNILEEMTMTVVFEKTAWSKFVVYGSSEYDGFRQKNCSFRASNGEPATVRFEFNEPIKDIFKREANGYALRIRQAEFIEFTDESEVPAGAEKVEVKGKDYYVSYERLNIENENPFQIEKIEIKIKRTDTEK